MTKINKFANVYDIDDKLIHKADSSEKMTLEQAEKLMKEYEEKLESLPENDQKRDIYETYIRNLSYWTAMNTPIDIDKLINTNEQVREALDDLAEEVINDRDTEEDPSTEVYESTTTDTESSEESPIRDDDTAQWDGSDVQPEEADSELLDRGETIMDEYVNFEEV